MKKAAYGMVAVCLLVSGFGSGWLASTTFAKQQTIKVAQPTIASSSERFVDKSNGQGMAPDEMYTELGSLSDTQFDSRYIAYSILMQNNITGMNRIAKYKAQNTDIKLKANDMWRDSSETTIELYNLQKSAGYAHH